ncbi:MAG: restriction endonuclease subunit S [Clostridium sp.]|nr:restriction endonuclease subunit S [Clostridium sp.]
MKCIEDEIPFELPEGWVWARFSAITINRDSERKPISSSQRTDVAKIYDYYGASGKIDKIDKYIFNERLLLIGEDGANLVTRSKPIAFFAEGQYWVNNHAHCIDATDKFILEYLCFYINAISLEKYVTGSAQPKMTQDNMHSILIPLPPYSEQKRMSQRLNEVMYTVDNIEIEKADISELASKAKAKILDLAIRGQLVPQNPDDEPASVLLERIRAEKEELIKQGKIKRDKKESIIFKGEDNSYYQRVELDGVVITQRVDIPSTWAACCLQEITYPISTVGMQIKSDEIQKEGVFPVISQGQIFIDGYCSDESKVIHDSPIILFGDHTRNVKYIDFPFVVGADGTKLHKAFQINERYVYYWMCYASQKITDRGYARHYSLLQKECFHLPPLAEQSRIVNCIDSLYAKLDSIGNEIL